MFALLSFETARLVSYQDGDRDGTQPSAGGKCGFARLDLSANAAGGHQALVAAQLTRGTWGFVFGVCNRGNARETTLGLA